MIKNNKREKRSERKISLPLFILNILTVIGVITFIIGFFVLREEMTSLDYTMFEKSRITYSVEDHAYGRILDSYYEEAPNLKPAKGTDAEAVALAEYIDASLQKGIFKAEGREDLALLQEKRMEESRLRTGIYQGEITEIDRKMQAAQGLVSP